jgi:hypothetical protein
MPDLDLGPPPPFPELLAVDTVDSAETTAAIAQSLSLGSSHFDPNSMTPSALVFYLSTRLGNVDGQMDEIFARESATEKVRGEVRALQELLGLQTATDKAAKLHLSGDTARLTGTAINAHIANITLIDKNLGETIKAHLQEEGQILNEGIIVYTTAELDNSKDYLSMVSKDLESGSQMDMIALQSLMGARQTAIQLATNLVSALSESQKAIVSNIG